MDGKAIHRCLHVLDLEKSIAFYEKALGMTEIRRMGPEDGSWTNVFMGSDASGFQLELTWNRGRTEPYDNGGRDSHLAFIVDDYEAARALHEEMGCICHVNEAMGLYFIEDPDGCWLEILPNKAEFAPQAGVDVLDAMARRRSLRRYSGEPVPQALLDRILEAGLRSASGRSRRPWELIVVHDRAMLDDLAAQYPSVQLKSGRGHAHRSRRGHRRGGRPDVRRHLGGRLLHRHGEHAAGGGSLGRGQLLDSGTPSPGGRWTLDPRVRCEPPEGASPLPAGGHPLSRHARSRSPAAPLR